MKIITASKQWKDSIQFCCTASDVFVDKRKWLNNIFYLFSSNCSFYKISVKLLACVM